MVTVGVTGASGFIGGALVPFLAARGYDLRLVDNRSGPIEVVYRDTPVERLDFESARGLALLSDCDVVLHLAAVSGVMACARDPVGTGRTNVSGTATLVSTCRERRIPVAFASSLAVVGAPKQFPVQETTPAHPTHEYARQKAAGEDLVRALGREGSVATAVARQSNVYGGYRADGHVVSKGNVIQLFAQQAFTGRLSVNAPGTQRRDFVHIEDVVAHWEAITRFLLRTDATPGSTTFHVASGESLSIIEVAERVGLAFRQLRPDTSPLRVEVVPNPRGGIELIEPDFTVSRVETERLIGLRCRYAVDSALPAILRDVESSLPDRKGLGR
ncbi:MAG: NAD-dependent epimerase/dehydratase family protein [Thermoplasmata archaeon]